MAANDRTLTAAGLILIYASIIGFTDNFVQVIASDAGIWQFHLTRSVMAIALLVAVAPLLRLRLRPVSWPAVAARSMIHGTGMVIYFGALAFLPVALVAAGLFTAPIFVALISRFAFGQRIGALSVLAIALGFTGVVLVLGPEALSGASLAAVLPVAAGVLYALGNIATRQWCAAESAETLLAGFFAGLAIYGALGLIALTLFGHPVPVGAEFWLMRGPVVPNAGFWLWTFVQAAGSLLGVGLMIRAYQITTAAKASVMEYVILPASAFWTWVIWGQGLSALAWGGMALIAAAGTLIALDRDRVGG